MVYGKHVNFLNLRCFYIKVLNVIKVGLVLTKCFRVGVSCRNLYSFVVYLYANGSGLITSVGEERANLSAVVYL